MPRDPGSSVRKWKVWVSTSASAQIPHADLLCLAPEYGPHSGQLWLPIYASAPSLHSVTSLDLLTLHMPPTGEARLPVPAAPQGPLEQVVRWLEPCRPRVLARGMGAHGIMGVGAHQGSLAAAGGCAPSLCAVRIYDDPCAHFCMFEQLCGHMGGQECCLCSAQLPAPNASVCVLVLSSCMG